MNNLSDWRKFNSVLQIFINKLIGFINQILFEYNINICGAKLNLRHERLHHFAHEEKQVTYIFLNKIIYDLYYFILFLPFCACLFFNNLSYCRPTFFRLFFHFCVFDIFCWRIILWPESLELLTSADNSTLTVYLKNTVTEWFK